MRPQVTRTCLPAASQRPYRRSVSTELDFFIERTFMKSFAPDRLKRYAFLATSPLQATCYLLLLASFVLQPSRGHAQTVSSLAITPSAPAVNIGGTTQLTVTATYSNGSTRNVSSGVSWGSAVSR